MAVDRFKNQAKNENRGTGSRYEKSIKKFAVTRKAHCLPSPSTIRHWAANVEAEPEFLMHVINTLEDVVPADERD